MLLLNASLNAGRRDEFGCFIRLRRTRRGGIVLFDIDIASLKVKLICGATPDLEPTKMLGPIFVTHYSVT